MKNKCLLVLSLLICCHCTDQNKVDGKLNPLLQIPNEKYYVPDQITAMKIAQAVWLPLYGEKIYSDTPYVCQLRDSVWVVQGTIRTGKGGAPVIIIGRSDAKVYSVSHGK